MIIELYRGPAGSGKSTHAANEIGYALKRSTSVCQCNADEYFVNDIGDYVFKPQELGLAHEQCFDKYMSAIQDQVDLIQVDNKNLTLWEIMPYLVTAKYYEIPVHVIEFDAHVNLRIANQTHGVPVEKIKKERLFPIPEHILSHYVSSITKVTDYNYEDAIVYDNKMKKITLGKYMHKGQVGVTIDSTDCDHCQSIMHYLINAHALSEWVDGAYYDAEGPTYVEYFHPSKFDDKASYHKDHLAEAHENGHPHSVSS